MARTRTLTNLISDVRLRADMASSQFVTDAEVTEYLNQSIAALFNQQVASQGMAYYEKSQTITTVSGTPLYALASDFYQVLMIEASLSGYLVELDPFERIDHGRLSQLPISGGLTVTVTYVPTPPRLSAGSDTFDGQAGWEEWVIVDSAMKCREKEDTDTAALAQRLARIEKLIATMIPNRDAGRPAKISDVRRGRLSPWASLPIPRYRVRGVADVSGSTAPNLELLQGQIPGGVW